MENQKCPVCLVEIDSNNTVLFSYGKAGCRDRLYSRVCQYAKKEGCINKQITKITEAHCFDTYFMEEDLR